MKFSLHFSLQSPTGDWPTLYQNTLTQVAAAEKFGFDSIFVAEHHFVKDGWIPSPRIICAAIAGLTKRVRIGTDIIVLPLHHPISVAEDAAVIDVLSNGRFILGVGLGNRRDEFEAFGVPFEERASRFEEALTLTRRLLNESNVKHAGRHFQFNNITVTPRSVQKPSPPIWVAAEKAASAVKRAARLGDAWVGAPMTPITVLKEHRKIYVNELRRLGKENPSERPLRREAFIGEDEHTAWDKAKNGILYLYGEDYFRWRALVDDNGVVLGPENVDFDQFVNVLKKRFILGGPDEFIAEVERYTREIQTNHMVLRVQFPGLSHNTVLGAIESLGRKVVPYFRDEH